MRLALVAALVAMLAGSIASIKSEGTDSIVDAGQVHTKATANGGSTETLV